MAFGGLLKSFFKNKTPEEGPNPYIPTGPGSTGFHQQYMPQPGQQSTMMRNAPGRQPMGPLQNMMSVQGNPLPQGNPVPKTRDQHAAQWPNEKGQFPYDRAKTFDESLGKWTGKTDRYGNHLDIYGNIIDYDYNPVLGDDSSAGY
tara:strand:+ start:348 stop:782 length:435 start_codon:yes stop_codon:yes gene_type:complete